MLGRIVGVRNAKFSFSAALASLLLLSATSTNATSVTVKELSVAPAKIVNINVTGFYSGGAYAGIVNMLVDGVDTDGFCIDPFHFSSTSSLQYEKVSLADAPKDFLPTFTGDMGVLKAEKISKLWAMAYSPAMTAERAAAMQIAIWEIVAGDLFSVSGSDYGAATLLAQIDTYTGPAANLIALTGPGQDYVIATVPEAGATLLLLAIGTGALAFFGRSRK